MNTRCDGENGSYDKDFGLFFPQLDGAVLVPRTNQNITVENEMIRAWSVVVSKDTQGMVYYKNRIRPSVQQLGSWCLDPLQIKYFPERTT